MGLTPFVLGEKKMTGFGQLFDRFTVSFLNFQLVLEDMHSHFLERKGSLSFYRTLKRLPFNNSIERKVYIEKTGRLERDRLCAEVFLAFSKLASPFHPTCYYLIKI